MNTRVPVIADGRVYAVFFYERGSFTESKLFAFDQATGKELWSYVTDHVGNEPVVSESVAYWSSFDGSVCALDARGNVLWKAPGAGSGVGVPAVDAQSLVVGELGRGSTTWCLHRTTGATIWHFKHDGHAYPLTLAAGRVYHTSAAHTRMDEPSKCTLYCLALESGRALWSSSGEDYMFNPVVLSDRVYVCSNRALRMFSAQGGKALEELKLEAEKTTLRLSVSSDERQLFVWRDSHGQGCDSVRAIDLKREKGLFGEKVAHSVAWIRPEPRGLCSPPIQFPSGELAYLTHDGVLCLISAGTGTIQEEVTLKSKPSSFGGIGLSGNSVAVTHGRNLFAFTAAA